MPQMNSVSMLWKNINTQESSGGLQEGWGPFRSPAVGPAAPNYQPNSTCGLQYTKLTALMNIKEVYKCTNKIQSTVWSQNKKNI